MRNLSFESPVELERGWRASSVTMPRDSGFYPVVLVQFMTHPDVGNYETKKLRLDLDKQIFIDPLPDPLVGIPAQAIAQFAATITGLILDKFRAA